MEYIIKNEKTGKIEHYCGVKIPENAIKIKGEWPGIPGEPNEFYDDKGCRKDLDTLLSEGLIKDNRGVYYASDKSKIEITSLNDPKPINCSKKKWSHKTDSLENGEWISNKKAKEKYDLKEKADNANTYLYSTDWYITRHLETEKPIPKEIKEKRAEARLVLEKNRRALEKL